MALYDLHCHSNASDGALSPSELVIRAHEQGVTALALTDHDTTDGLAEARETAVNLGMQFIPGIELSATWEHKCFHIVGLGIDPEHPVLFEGITRQQNLRAERAHTIARKLEKKRIPGAYEAVKKAVGDGMITRSHFADYLLETHHVNTHQEAFDRYLGQGRPAYVSTIWATLVEVVDWITASGGVAVLAHPLRYHLSANKMNRALHDFKQAGGQGIEVVTGRSSEEDIRLSHRIAVKFELNASQGSDFHTPNNHWVELGRMANLPEGSRPIWELLA